MSTVIHSLQQPIRVNRLTFELKDVAWDAEASTEETSIPADDGLGCMRGFAMAVFCNVLFALMIAAGYELWRHLR